MRALLLLVLLISPSYAEDTPTPPSISVVGMTPVQYNDLIAELDYALGLQLAAAIGAVMRSNDPAAFEAWRVQTIDTLNGELSELRRVPPYKGDSTLVDATARSLEWFIHALEIDLAELATLMTKPEVVSGDLDRAELLVKGYTAEGKRHLDEQRAAQAAFAKKHRFLLVEGDTPTVDGGPVFVAPHLVPAGSLLTAEQHVSFAARYTNAVLARQNALVDVLNAFLSASAGPDFQCSASRERAVEALGPALAQARLLGDWRGDKSLSQALEAVGALVEDQLTDDYARYCATIELKRPKPAQITEVNRVAEEANKEMQAALNAFNALLAEFQGRWGLIEYAAWAASVGG